METLREKANTLPDSPGVYRMLDSSGEIIYVGKAKNLKNRVSQYFQDTASHTLKTKLMVAGAADFQVIIVNSELEALLLENALIKKYRPKYNILLKDDKGYPYIRLDVSAQYPSFSLVNKPAQDGAEYFGPFGGRGASYEIIDALKDAFRLPKCSRVFPRDVGRGRPCLNYQMKLCAGYCRPEASPEEYRESAAMAAEILKGRYRQLTGDVKARMLAAAEEMDFESAARLRDRYKALKSLENRQTVTGSAPVLDAAACALSQERAVLCVLHYGPGGLAGKDLIFGGNPLGEDEGTVLEELLRQYYANGAKIPKTVCLSAEPADAEQLSRSFSSQAGALVRAYRPQRGEKAVYARLAGENALQELLRVESKVKKRRGPAELLQKALSLENPPERVEAYDISNTAGRDTVGSMIVFQNGKSAKSQYRSFVLNGDPSGDDYAAMREVLARRFKRLEEGAAGFDRRPDLVLIDGGAAHAAAAREIVDAFDATIPLCGMVKDSHHRTRALVLPDGREIGIKNEQALYAFVGKMQEEAHRFAIGLHRKRRGKSVTASGLDSIPGVGEKRKLALLAAFKSVAAISKAEKSELAMVVPVNTAAAVYEYFHTGEGK